MTTDVRLFGAAYSVYTRIVRLLLEECGVPYELVETDIFDRDSLPADYGDRHPFLRIPAFEHGAVRLFESDAIAHYVLAAFGHEDLLPRDALPRARCIQIMRILDNYGFARLVWGVYVEEINRGRAGRLEAAEIADARKVLAVLDELSGSPWLTGENYSLADIWALPMIAYLRLAPAGAELLSGYPKLEGWSERMSRRASVCATRFPDEDAQALFLKELEADFALSPTLPSSRSGRDSKSS